MMNFLENAAKALVGNYQYGDLNLGLQGNTFSLKAIFNLIVA